MPVQKSSLKAAVSVSEMAQLVELSRSRFFCLTKAGVFPEPINSSYSNRPIYDQALQQQCLDIRRTCIGLNGQPILFNRKSNSPKSRDKTNAKQEHAEMLNALGELGLKTTAPVIAASITKLFPAGIDGADRGQVIKRVFQDIKRNKR